MTRPKMTESELQYAILDLAKLLGLLVHHCRPAPIRNGKWITPIQGNAGFVDLVLAGPGGICFAELKGDRTQPTEMQTRWLETLITAGADAHLWRPKNWTDGTIERQLKRLAKPREVTS